VSKRLEKMMEWPESVQDISDALFPNQSSWWVVPFWKFHRWGFFWPAVGTGGDEWGWHTFYVTVPLVGQIVVRTKRCDCEEMEEFKCPWPACPQSATQAGGYCFTHDREYAEELLAEVAAKEASHG
jgi:hypothetical protein